jgi:nickel-dependent lactate racemase
MKLDLKFGDTTQPLSVPDKNLIAVLEPADRRPFHDTGAALDRALIDCAAFIGEARRVLVLVNDYTRPTPNATILAALGPALTVKDARYLVCTGTHRAPSDDDYAAIFGPEFFARHRGRISSHDCQDKTRLYFAGKTKFGTPVWFNRELLWADRVVTINSIEPHYFAGYTGGRKGFLPGIAGYETITHNHNMVTRPGSQTFGLDGNPVHEDMVEAYRMVNRPVFSVQVVQDRNHQLLAVRCGTVHSSFTQACNDARRVFAVQVDAPAEIVVSVLRPPYDINFYQSQRAVESARPVLKRPSAQVTVSACRDGVGNDGFIQVFKGCSAARQVLDRPPGDARLGWHKSARLAQIMQHTQLFTVMNIPDDTARAAFMTPFHSIQEAFDAALARLGNSARAYVIPDAGAVVPQLPGPA